MTRPQRAAYDAATVFADLDAGVLAHVAYAIDGQPFVTPTCYWPGRGGSSCAAWCFPRQCEVIRVGLGSPSSKLITAV